MIPLKSLSMVNHSASSSNQIALWQRRRVLGRGLLAVAALALAPGCGTFSRNKGHRPRNEIVVSVADQRMGLYDAEGKLVRTFDVSTSKFGLGDTPGSYRTPLGLHRVAAKIGCNAPMGAVFKSRRMTGEVLPPDAPGRDPIVTRILWLQGLESQNGNAYRRYIYIHGTAEERNIGKPVSYGCVRMRSTDVVELYNVVPVGAKVRIIEGSLRGRPPRRQRA